MRVSGQGASPVKAAPVVYSVGHVSARATRDHGWRMADGEWRTADGGGSAVTPFLK